MRVYQYNTIFKLHQVYYIIYLGIQQPVWVCNYSSLLLNTRNPSKTTIRTGRWHCRNPVYRVRFSERRNAARPSWLLLCVTYILYTNTHTYKYIICNVYAFALVLQYIIITFSSSCTPCAHANYTTAINTFQLLRDHISPESRAHPTLQPPVFIFIFIHLLVPLLSIYYYHFYYIFQSPGTYVSQLSVYTSICKCVYRYLNVKNDRNNVLNSIVSIWIQVYVVFVRFAVFLLTYIYIIQYNTI